MKVQASLTVEISLEIGDTVALVMHGHRASVTVNNMHKVISVAVEANCADLHQQRWQRKSKSKSKSTTATEIKKDATVEEDKAR